MKLEKNQLRFLAIVGILLLVFNIIAFVAPFNREGLFWTAWAFTNLAIVLQIVFVFTAFKSGSDVKSKFYGIPIARIGLVYLVVQLIVGLAAMGLSFLPGCPVWPFLIVFIIILAVAAIGLIAAEATREEIERQDTVLKKNVSVLRGLQSLGNSLVAQCDTPEASAELKKLAEQLRFSDPVSSDATADAEHELATVMEELQRAVLENDCAGVVGLAKRAQATLAERNRICKLNK